MGSVLCGCFGGDCRGESKDKTDGGKGKPLSYDADFKGPIRGKARRPKDILCLILFVVFIIFMGAIAVYAWVEGEPLRIIYPTDSKGRLCGVQQQVADKPFLMFFDLTKCVQVVTVGELISGDVSASTLFTCPTPQVCVSECPTANEFGVRNNPVCVDSVDTSRFVNLTSSSDAFSSAQNIALLLEHISEEECAPYYITSTAVARRCIPTFVNVQDQFEEVFNFNTSEDIQNTASASGFGDLFLNLSVSDLVDGSFTQALLVNSRQFLLDVYQDFVVVWPALLIGVVLALAFSFIYICLLRWIAGPIIGIGIAACFVLILAITIFCYYQFYCFQDAQMLFNSLQDAINSNVNVSLTEFVNTTQLEGFSAQICAATSPLRELIDTQLPWFQYQEWTWLAAGILGTLIFLILLILLIALIKKIRISIAIIKESSKAVGGVPTSVFYPALTWVFLIALFIYWGVVAVFLVTASQPTYVIVMNGSTDEADRNFTGQNKGVGIVTNGTPCDTAMFTNSVYIPHNAPGSSDVVSVQCLFDQFVTSNFLLGIQIYHLFGLFWIGNFILALGEVTLAGAFASWYWAFKKPKDVPTFALIQSFGRALLFHAGSIAFGSLIIAIVQLMRVILAYVQKKLKGKTGKVAQALLCLLQCCLWCFEKILRYINRQAYIEIAIYGYDFCTGACKAVKLLLRNILVTAVKDRIVAFLLFLGKVAITCAIGVLAYLGFGGYLGLGETLWNQPLNYYLIPVIFLIIITYFIASGFMTVYHMAVDTIFICALEDLERNNGHDKPYFMSKKLMKLLNAKNVKTDGTDGTDGAVQMESLETVNA